MPEFDLPTWVRRSAVAQGFPEFVEDPRALDRIARLLTSEAPPAKAGPRASVVSTNTGDASVTAVVV